MNTITETIITNLTSVGTGVAIFIISYLANMCAGIWFNTKICGQTFDWSRILESVLKIICVGISIVCLTLAITLIIPFAKEQGLMIPTEYEEVIKIVTTLTICLRASLKYIKESWDKINKIFNNIKEG